MEKQEMTLCGHQISLPLDLAIDVYKYSGTYL